MPFRDDMKAASVDIIDSLGETAFFTGVSGPYTVNVIFDPGDEVIDPYTGDITNTAPTVHAKTSEVKNAKHKDTLRIGNVTYEVIESRDDGFGVTVMTLNKIRTD